MTSTLRSQLVITPIPQQVSVPASEEADSSQCLNQYTPSQHSHKLRCACMLVTDRCARHLPALRCPAINKPQVEHNSQGTPAPCCRLKRAYRLFFQQCCAWGNQNPAIPHMCGLRSIVGTAFGPAQPGDAISAEHMLVDVDGECWSSVCPWGSGVQCPCGYYAIPIRYFE